MRYFIELSYKGRNYHGWQIQPNDNSVQQTIEKALSVLLGRDIAVVGCGRTDAGVHARQFYLHFDSDRELDKEKLKYRMNALLPEDIAIFQVMNVKDEAHARFDASLRTYEYHISLTKDVFYNELSMRLNGPSLNLEKMNHAASLLLKYSDFKCFSRSNSDVKSYVCQVSEARWNKKDDRLIFVISANRFLRNMVRAVVGTLLQVGLGKMSMEEFKMVLESRDRTKAGASVKAHGLFLTAVKYPQEIFIDQHV